ncbi:MAG: copper-translocating P-type ATPase [Candidatus Liptonbacteria bacterium]|nr:copper-translocating P-type ATPase [Candidatus Liptonbacteria bacterium]
MEAKQYEYQTDKKIGHAEHEEHGSQGETIYTCPMHPEVKQRGPGKCPGCGMDFIPQKAMAVIPGEHAGHDMQAMSHMDHEAAMTSPQMAEQMERDMRKRFWISFLLSIPIFLYSPVGTAVFRVHIPSLIPVNWLLLVLTTPIVFWTGSIFITGTYYSLKAKKLNMAVLIATGVLAAYIFSVLLTFIGSEETFYEAAALLVTFVLFGHWMEMKSRRGTSDALRVLFDLVPPQASVLRDGKEIIILSAEVVQSDIVIIRPGNKIPVDGEVIEGETYINEALVTGESLPVHKKIGSQVVGGSINERGSIKFKATKVGGETVLAQIIKMVEAAQNSKAPGQRLADKAAAWLVILAISSGLAAFFGWYVVAGASLLTALTFAVSTVVIACPDALGLATPTAVAVGTGLGAKHNILIKDAATLERTSKINAMILDKTGTLTMGEPEVTDVVSFIEMKQPEVQKNILQVAASIEKHSEHPLARTIVKKASKDGVELLNISKFEAVAGYGVKGFIVGLAAGLGKSSSHPLDTAIQKEAGALKAEKPEIKEFKVEPGFGLQGKIDSEGYLVLLGNQRLMESHQAPLSYEVRQKIEQLQSEGKTAMLLAIDKEVIGAIAVADTPRENSKRMVAELIKNGIEITMITGDNQSTAEAIAKQMGIERVFADVLPADKAIWVKKLQNEGKFVAMVGDGINDAPALAQADIGIAIGAGTDVAIETGNIVLMKSDPYDIVAAIRLSKATVLKMKQNLFWAAIYNVLAIPVAAGVFYKSFGLSLRPEIAALLMSVSSIVVATNAVLLKRVEPKLKI